MVISQFQVVPNGRIAGDMKVEAIARLNGVEVARTKGIGSELSFKIAEPKRWTPDSPTIYDLEVHVNDDVVHSYFGIREVGKSKDNQGHWRFTLNGDPIFHWGPLRSGLVAGWLADSTVG